MRRRSAVLSREARDELADKLRHDIAPEHVPAAVEDLAGRADAFLAEDSIARANSDEMVTDAVERLKRAADELRAAYRRLPPRARGLLVDVLHAERNTDPAFLSRFAADATTLRYASLRVRAALRRVPGRPRNRRAEALATTVRDVLESYGVRGTTYWDGPLARCLGILLPAVGHNADIKTLLDAVIDTGRPRTPRRRSRTQ